MPEHSVGSLETPLPQEHATPVGHQLRALPTRAITKCASERILAILPLAPIQPEGSDQANRKRHSDSGGNEA